ncbi:20811_t:CDS:2, partial [Entrophospora sp. SA101]
ILRVFDAPKTFIRSLSKLSINKNLEYISSMQPVGANLPALGLSNKAIFQSDIEKLSEIAEPEEFLSRQNYLHSSSAPNSLMQTLNHPPSSNLLRPDDLSEKSTAVTASFNLIVATQFQLSFTSFAPSSLAKSSIQNLTYKNKKQ